MAPDCTSRTNTSTRQWMSSPKVAASPSGSPVSRVRVTRDRRRVRWDRAVTQAVRPQNGLPVVGTRDKQTILATDGQCEREAIDLQRELGVAPREPVRPRFAIAIGE